MAQQVVSQLRSKGKVVRGWLGIGIQEVTAELATKFGIKESDGVLVNDVFENEPAARAGLKPGDIIAKVDGRRVETPSALSRSVAGLAPGTKVELEIIRNGDRRPLTVDLGERKEETIVASIPSPPPQPEVRLGLNVQDLTPDLAEKFKIKDQRGVLISKSDPAARHVSGGVQDGGGPDQDGRLGTPARSAGKSRVLFRPKPQREINHTRGALRSVCGRRRFGLLLFLENPHRQLARHLLRS